MWAMGCGRKIRRSLPNVHLTSHSHDVFFFIAQKEEKERKKGEREVVFGCTRGMWTNAFKR
jgi:hypothetical protein